MKSNRSKPRFFLISLLACSLLTFLSSCAMSEQEAGKRGGLAGTLVGATGAAAIAKKNGASTAESVVIGLIGGALGSEMGQKAGRGSSTLKGLEDVKTR